MKPLISKKKKYTNSLVKLSKTYFLGCAYEEDAKGVIRMSKSRKDRLHNEQKKKDKRTKRSTKHTHEAKDQVT